MYKTRLEKSNKSAKGGLLKKKEPNIREVLIICN